MSELLLRSIIAVAIALSTVIAAATPSIALDIKGRTGSAPFSTRARISVEPHADNRYLCVSWTQIRGGVQQRTSCTTHEGTGPKTTWKLLKDLSAGQWEVVAYVIRNDEQAIFSGRITLTIIGIGYEPSE